VKYFELLRRRDLAMLWLSQVLSAIGDQIYLITAVWIAIQISPTAAALVAGADFAAALICGLIGGIYTDRLNRRSAMIVVDLLRGVAVATLPIAAQFGAINTWHLVLVGVIIGAFGTLFDPCLIASLKSLTDSNESLTAMNGLTDATLRLARIVGPGVAGFLAVLMPIPQLFILDAISFFISAAGVAALDQHHDWKPRKDAYISKGFAGVLKELREALYTVSQHRLIAWDFASFGVLNVLWSIIFSIGLPTLIKEHFAGGIGVYGSIIGVYGLGGLIGNIILGNMSLRKPWLLRGMGNIAWGLGFLAIALAPNLNTVLIAASFAAIGGPLVNLTTVTIMQTDIPGDQIGKVYSLRSIIANCGKVLGFLFAALLFSHCPASTVIAVAATIYPLFGIAEILRFGRAKKKETSLGTTASG
jgi:MFS transporter, DHA3 family, macrolide efflux protein